MMQLLDREPGQELTSGDGKELEGHLATCRTCQDEWQSLYALESLLRQAPVLRPAPGFAGRVMARIDRRQRRVRLYLGGAFLAAAAAIIIAIAVVPTIGAAPALARWGLSLFHNTGYLVARFTSAAGTLLRALWLGMGALMRSAAPVAICGLAMATMAGLVWLEFLRRLQPVEIKNTL
jgi:predicted anti-sigma-YlaC factor YlaD